MITEQFNIFSLFLTFIIGFCTIWYAKSQSDSAKAQVEIAKSTNNETKRILEDIKKTVEKVEIVTDKTKEEVGLQINKLIENQNEHQKTLMTNFTAILSNFDPKQKQNDQMSQTLMNGFLNGTLDVEKLINLANKFPPKP